MFIDSTAEWLALEPELHIIFSTHSEFQLTIDNSNLWRKEIIEAAGDIFEKRFGIPVDLEVVIQHGSIWVKVKPKLEALALILTIYIGLHQAPRYFADDVSWCWEKLTPMVTKIITRNADLKTEDVYQVKGAIERLDELVYVCRENNTWRDVDLAEAKGNLSLIHLSKDSEKLVPALNKYLEALNPDKKEKDQEGKKKELFDFLPAVLCEEERRRRQRIKEKCKMQNTEGNNTKRTTIKQSY